MNVGDVQSARAAPPPLRATYEGRQGEKIPPPCCGAVGGRGGKK